MENILNLIYSNMYVFIILFWAFFLLFCLVCLTGERQIEGEGDSIEDMSNPERVNSYIEKNRKEIEEAKKLKFKFLILQKINERKRAL